LIHRQRRHAFGARHAILRPRMRFVTLHEASFLD
jgi:hypothetical protein